MTHKLTDEELERHVDIYLNSKSVHLFTFTRDEWWTILSELRQARRAAKKVKEGLEEIIQLDGKFGCESADAARETLADPDAKAFLNPNKETDND